MGWLLGAWVALLLTGCASYYVDGAVKEVPAAQMPKPAQPRPVQVFFEFQTKGVANASATGLLKSRVLQQVEESGLFSQIGEVPVAQGGSLSLTLNNVALTDGAFAKGFVTGLTLGLVGSKGSDGYVCTATYTPADGSAPLVKTARHVIHTAVGATSAPPNAVKVAAPDEAVYIMVRQVLSQVLADLAADPSFGH